MFLIPSVKVQVKVSTMTHGDSVKKDFQSISRNPCLLTHSLHSECFKLPQLASCPHPFFFLPQPQLTSSPPGSRRRQCGLSKLSSPSRGRLLPLLPLPEGTWIFSLEGWFPSLALVSGSLCFLKGLGSCLSLSPSLFPSHCMSVSPRCPSGHQSSPEPALPRQTSQRKCQQPPPDSVFAGFPTAIWSVLRGDFADSLNNMIKFIANWLTGI